MESLGKDVLTLIALEMAYPDILKFCSSSSKINKAVCKNEDFWRNKLYKTYPRLKHWRFSNYKKAYQDTEKIMYDIFQIKSKPLSPFFSPNYIKQEYIDFLSYANFGTFFESEIPLNFLFFPLLDLRIFNVPLLMNLFNIYSEVNSLHFTLNGKKYYKTGSDMEKYLGKYLDSLEKSDREKGDVFDFTGKLKIKFDRNQFPFVKFNFIATKALFSIKRDSLTESEKEILSKTGTLTSIIGQYFFDYIKKGNKYILKF